MDLEIYEYEYGGENKIFCIFRQSGFIKFMVLEIKTESNNTQEVDSLRPNTCRKKVMLGIMEENEEKKSQSEVKALRIFRQSGSETRSRTN